MLSIGPFETDIPKDSQVEVEGQTDFTILAVDDKGIAKGIIGNSIDRRLKMTTRQDVKVRVLCPKTCHVAMEARPIRPVHEVVSDIPVEVDVDVEPLSLEDKIKQFCATLVQHQFGRDSAEVDQFEESFDFDIPDDDDVLLSGHEVVQMNEEIPLEPRETKNVVEEKGEDVPSKEAATQADEEGGEDKEKNS